MLEEFNISEGMSNCRWQQWIIHNIT